MRSPKESTLFMIELYYSGLSFEKIGKKYNLSRQAVWERMSRVKGFIARKKKDLPFIELDGIKFTLNEYGYYRSTRRDRNLFLHRYIYEKEYGKIPDDWDVHHVDENKQNNELSNLMALSKSDHTKLHQERKKNDNQKI
jgi:hypothetical protein